MAEYIGITIGPIIETLMLAETPATLWYASFLFSSLSRKICEKIIEKNIEVLSPCTDGFEIPNDGAGRYLDRIILKSGDAQTVSECIEVAKKEISEIVANDTQDKKNRDKYIEFMLNYLCIHMVKAEANENENAICVLGKKLDALEQMPSFNKDDDFNPLKVLFKGEKDGTNFYIHKSMFLKSVQSNTQLLMDVENNETDSVEKSSKKKKFKSISDIAGEAHLKKEKKKYSYYAVVQSDGDGMGSFFAQCPNDKIKDFSKKCFVFLNTAVNVIKQYNGMTIYAGGDDLLFIAPIESKAGTVFKLCQELNTLFNECFADEKITVSLGISLRYEKYPLYEALSAALDALVQKSKRVFADKNTLTIDFNKHSGQAELICIPLEKMGFFLDVINLSSKIKTKDDKDKANSVNSIIYILTSLSAMFKEAKKDEQCIKNILKNQYDNAEQEQYRDYIDMVGDKLAEYLKTDAEERRILLKDESEKIPKEDHDLKCFENMLRLGKFLVEKGGAEQ